MTRGLMVLALAMLAACATPAPRAIDLGATALPVIEGRVMLMPPRVEMSVMTASGPQPRDDWALSAANNLTAALCGQLDAMGAGCIVHHPDEGNAAQTEQVMLLADAVLEAVTAHVAPLTEGARIVPLPNHAREPADFSLGDGLAALATQEDAQLAMLVTARYQTESGGVFLTKVLAGAATGFMPVSASFRGAHLTVANARTGEIVWMKATQAGDPRKPEDADAIIAELLSGLPAQGMSPQ